jgi:phospholipid/cholesterol/gamma-HCH transport system substrate-binding protein
MGAVVLAIAAIFLAFAYSAAQLHTAAGYPLYARFNKIDGVRSGGDVRLSGIKVGTIISTTLDTKSFQAVVQLAVDNDVKLPDDSVAEISSSGLLGDKFLELVPGASDTMLKPGGIIQFTQSPTSIESMLGQVIYSVSHGGAGANAGSGANASGNAGAAPAAANAPKP